MRWELWVALGVGAVAVAVYLIGSYLAERDHSRYMKRVNATHDKVTYTHEPTSRKMQRHEASKKRVRFK